MSAGDSRGSCRWCLQYTECGYKWKMKPHKRRHLTLCQGVKSVQKSVTEVHRLGWDGQTGGRWFMWDPVVFQHKKPWTNGSCWTIFGNTTILWFVDWSSSVSPAEGQDNKKQNSLNWRKYCFSSSLCLVLYSFTWVGFKNMLQWMCSS